MTNGKTSAERIGFYICHCGVNISTTVDVTRVRDAMARIPDVVISRDYKFMCSNAGQDLIKDDIRNLNLTRVVVAACSPLMHEPTFRAACEDAGLNRYLFQMSNIREHCSWVHEDRAAATEKATDLARAAVYRVRLHEPMQVSRVPINPTTLILGGGIAGIQAALEIANAGSPVYLVEREPTIGGNMAYFDKTFPTLDCSACILTPKMVNVGQKKNISLLTWSEVMNVSGFIGNFKVKIRKKARYVDTDKCTGCGQCWSHCPSVRIPHRRTIMLGPKLVINQVRKDPGRLIG
ncbi:MAG: CoB--CoM heterodisulfide reductase iron-sulfur subunit A family protein [Candidatus Zixiibacteriota bacterium]|nr:MAG: CoB--CoM heterodisulfide reductase iron-sulfur subunit A family protein [candidate division Zixibacteria bacterium]